MKMKIYELETRNSGEDDVLLGEDIEAVRGDVEDMEEKGWSLREIPYGEYLDTWEQLQHRSHTHEEILQKGKG